MGLNKLKIASILKENIIRNSAKREGQEAYTNQNVWGKKTVSKQ